MAFFITNSNNFYDLGGLGLFLVRVPCYNIYEMSKQSKKLTILYVLKILKDGSNKEHPISQSVITKTINLMGIPCDRKTISRDIDCLITYGYDIVKIRGGGCYFNSTDFTMEDIENMLSGVSRLDISVQEKVALNKKIKKLININER